MSRKSDNKPEHTKNLNWLQNHYYNEFCKFVFVFPLILCLVSKLSFRYWILIRYRERGTDALGFGKYFLLNFQTWSSRKSELLQFLSNETNKQTNQPNKQMSAVTQCYISHLGEISVIEIGINEHNLMSS